MEPLVGFVNKNHSIPLVEERDGSKKMVKRYHLAVKMGKNAFDCKRTLGSSKNSKICEKAYKMTASLEVPGTSAKSILLLMCGRLKKVGILFIFTRDCSMNFF
jgi:hypothetical protein